jgi:hypothetical protein
MNGVPGDGFGGMVAVGAGQARPQPRRPELGGAPMADPHLQAALDIGTKGSGIWGE